MGLLAVGVVVSSSRRAPASDPRRRLPGLPLGRRRSGRGGSQLAPPDEHEDRRQRDQRDRAEHPERVLEAAGERRRNGVPACASAFVWLAATLEAIAIPIAPPSCWDVLSSPDASPARRSSTPASAAIEIGMNANAVPAPATRHRPGEVRQEVAVDRHLGGPDHPRADQRHADRQHGLRADARDQQLRDAGERDRRQRGGQPRDSGLQRAVVQHLLHVQRPDEDEREEAAAEQQPGDVRAGQRAQPEDRQRQDRLAHATLDHDERRRAAPPRPPARRPFVSLPSRTAAPGRSRPRAARVRRCP